MPGLEKLGESVGVKVMGGSNCSKKYGGKKGRHGTKKVRKSKKSKKTSKRKTAKKSFFSRLFKL